MNRLWRVGGAPPPQTDQVYRDPALCSTFGRNRFKAANQTALIYWIGKVLFFAAAAAAWFWGRLSSINHTRTRINGPLVPVSRDAVDNITIVGGNIPWTPGEGGRGLFLGRAYCFSPLLQRKLIYKLALLYPFFRGRYWVITRGLNKVVRVFLWGGWRGFKGRGVWYWLGKISGRGSFFFSLKITKRTRGKFSWARLGRGRGGGLSMTCR